MRLDDICLVNSDVTASDDFYRLDLGFERRMRNVRFVDFVFESGPRLAMWMRPSIAETVGAVYPSSPGLPFRVTVGDGDDVSRVVADPDGFATVLTVGSPRITMLELAVSDVARTASFLSMLGFDPAPEHGDIAFEGGGLPIVLRPLSDVPLPDAAAPDGWTRNGGHVMLAIELDTGDAVDGAHDELVARGLQLSGPPALYEWGARSTYAVDPDGFIWEIYAWVEEPR
ncbi:VOC family protein [Cnuibacter sp. UC19_7]|uniref:VOC family protein n=1 Tax=Cnuibacter sp. UC19_7 TaxID=3350166 RepID=UPI00366AF26F